MAHILIVDDEPDLRDLLSQILATEGHSCDQAANGEEGCRRVADRDYDLVITDVRMPGMSGIDFLRQIQPTVESRTPCMIITALGDDVDLAVEAIRVGACNFLRKPFDMAEIREAVNRGLSLRHAYRFRRDYKRYLEERIREKEQELQETYDGTISAMAQMLEGKDNTTAEHCLRVRDYCTILAREMGVPEEQIRNIQLGAILHDIGKYRVPDRILMKPGGLDAEEWEEMRRHPIYGAEFVREIPFLAGASEIIENHHERWDGEGYPSGRHGEEIPLSARIFSVVDAFDAICEERCYKGEQPPETALDEIRRHAGTQFDPDVVDAFCREHVFRRIRMVKDRFPPMRRGAKAWVDRPVVSTQNGRTRSA
jgi:cyclic di-GMP phosphodiesterase